jgi:hypothetical protein
MPLFGMGSMVGIVMFRVQGMIEVEPDRRCLSDPAERIFQYRTRLALLRTRKTHE